MRGQTKYYIDDGTGAIEKIVSIEDASDLYRQDPQNTYPPSFYLGCTKCRHWQIAIGESIGKMYQIRSVVDFGCGLGCYLEGFKKAGATDIRGFEVSYDNAKLHMSKDIVDNISQNNIMDRIDCGTFDLSMSVEVAEHILPETSEIFIDNMVRASNKYILFTAAPPGQGGTCHINEKPMLYWANLFKDRGFEASQLDIDNIRNELKKIPFRRRSFNMIRNQIVLFIKK